MQIRRIFGLILMSLMFLNTVVSAGENNKTEDTRENKEVTTEKTENAQQLVETVDIMGNRRLRDEDLISYIRTRPGDTYDPQLLERDLQELLSLNFFDKTYTRVLTQPGVRGGVDVIFEVRELPIIRDLQFEGAKAIQESDILKAFRENRVGISKEAVYDPVKARNARRVLREMLASKGYPNAKIEVKEEEVSATSVAITFDIDQGRRSRIVDIEFEGNENFSDGELRGQLQYVQETGLISRFKGQDILDLRKLEADLQRNVREYMRSKGYFQARIGEPEVVGLGYKRTGIPILGVLPLPLISSKDDTLKVVIPVSEGRIYRVGEISIEGNSIFSEQVITQIIGLQKGEIADGKRLRKALYEDLKNLYGSQGFVEYDVELTPDLKDSPNNPKEGIIDIAINIDEGKQYRLRRLEFVGNTFTRDRVLRREVLVNEGDIYNQNRLEISIARLNQTQYFDPIDKEKDLEVRTNPDQADVDAIIKVSERGRQQISFNGGISGIGGTFFGLEYSTNNLLGRGEVLSFQFGAGNRQQSFQFSFQEPYFQDRPVSVGFSLFASRAKFFGEGTFLSNNTDAFIDALNPLGSLTTNEENLFTQTTYGASVFATAPLSEFFFKKRRFTQFSRIGLTYQFSATTITDPPVNETDPTRAIPVIFAQPNIITSRITPTFVYDTRQPSANGIDTLRGTQLSASLAFTGLGGDVRTYRPTITYSKFIPVRRVKDGNGEVFAFRLQAGSIGSFATSDKIRNANSLSFIGGVPIYERYFLGSEFDVRGYNARAIGPIVPFDTFATTQNVVVANNFSGEPIVNEDISAADVAALTQFATFTGPDAANPLLLSRNYRFVGGDTQILGNFEYRVPIFGPLTMAAFADIGSVFNLRKTGTQTINSTFLRDDQILQNGVVPPGDLLTFLALVNNPNFESGAFLTTSGLVQSFILDTNNGNQVLTRTNYENLYCGGVRADCPVAIPEGLTPIFLRADAQTNALLRLNDAAFDSIGDFRTSIGFEARIQVPVVNVPFRLIYYYNPGGVFGFSDQVPGLPLPGKRSGFRFTVGRTF
jgi:outer membrane protein insertion porin family